MVVKLQWEVILILVKAGPKYEDQYPKGVSHFLEKLAFHSCSEFDDINDYLQQKDYPSPAIECQRARDFIMYASFGLAANSSDLVKILASSVLQPKLLDDEVDFARKMISNELLVQTLQPPVDPVLNDLLLRTAYGNKHLGYPQFCPEKNIATITRSDLQRFMHQFYRPERMTLIGVGIDHDTLLQSAQDNFFPWKPSFAQAQDSPVVDETEFASVYTGGSATLERDLKQYHAPLPEMAHLGLGFEGPSTEDIKSYVCMNVLQSLLGGGGSFSAGGPGKGMYSRFYTEVLNNFYWVNSCQALSHPYKDSSVFMVQASCEPEMLDKLVGVVIRELRTLEMVLPSLSDNDLNRAKSHLKSLFLMSLEMKPVLFEDLGRQLLHKDKKPPVEEWIECIKSSTREQLRDVLHKMLQSNPTVVGYGKCQNFPDYEE
ncbi:hypothetical protein Ciccas_008779, partial [Cichlidogyrus casuarinus]